MGHKIIQHLSQFLNIFKFLVVLLIKFWDENLKGCQKKVSQFLLHQAVILLQNLITIVIPIWQ